MKLGFLPQSIVDLDGMPLVGRVTLYAHDSDTKIAVFTLEGEEFVQAANPQLLDNAGRLPATLFYEASIVDVKVEKYIGAEGMMSVDSPDSDFETFDIFEIGFSPESLHSGVHVDTVAELEDAAVSSRVVTVLGYHKVGDCMPRMYYWDKDSVDEVDGGYVVGSNEEDSGRWILLWTNSVIPGSVYGIVPGTNESNIGAFLSYPSTVGSFLMPTASVPFFERGEYSSSVLYSSTRSVSFDGGAKFPTAAFSLPSVSVVGHSDDYIANFAFTRRNAVAHSSWFKSVDAFWNCGAGRLFIDGVNHFVNTVLENSADLEDTVVEGTGRLVMTYGIGKFIQVKPTTVIVGRIFTGADYLKVDSSHGDGIFTKFASLDVGTIADGHHIEYTGVPDISLFDDANRWATIMVERRARLTEQEWNLYTLDFEGRIVDSFSAGLFTTVKNVVASRIVISNPGTIILLRNVKAENVVVSCGLLSILSSDINFETVPSCTQVYSANSIISSSQQLLDPNVGINFKNCRVIMSFNRVTDNVTKDSRIRLEGCNVDANVIIYSKNLELINTTFNSGVSVKIYPYKENGYYYLQLDMEGCNFLSSSLEFTKLDIVGGAADDDCYDCILQWKIVGNNFVDESNTRRTMVNMRYWMNRMGTYGTRCLVSKTGDHSIVYSGNSGQCPKESVKGLVCTGSEDYHTWQVSESNNIYQYYNSKAYAMPSRYTGWYMVKFGNDGTVGMKYGSDNAMKRMDSALVYQTANDTVETTNGSFFDFSPAKFGSSPLSSDEVECFV